MFPALRPFLNKGGAGYSISRAETAERLSRHVEHASDLLRGYASALAHLRRRESAARIEEMLPYLRSDVAKLYESIYSAGGRTPSRLPDTPLADDASASDAGVFRALIDREQEFGEAVYEEIDAVHHQERTRAILKAVGAGSNARLELLRELAGLAARP